MFAKFTEILTSRRFWQVFVIGLVQMVLALGWISGDVAQAIVDLVTLVLGASVSFDTIDKFATKIGK